MGGVLGAQNRTQNEFKFKTILKSETVALQEPLGAVLGRSWGILEAILGSKKRLEPFILKGSVKIHIFDKISFQDAFWTDLGPSWPPKVPKMTPNWHPKTTPNRPKIDVEK